MQRATAHEARGYWHAGRGNGHAANAHFARARAIRSAFGARVDDAYDRVAGEVVRAYIAVRKLELERPSRAIELFAAELRRKFPGGAPRCITSGLDENDGDEVLLYGPKARFAAKLSAFNGCIVIELHDAGEMHHAEGNKRGLDESEHGASKRAEYDAAMES